MAGDCNRRVRENHSATFMAGGPLPAPQGHPMAGADEEIQAGGQALSGLDYPEAFKHFEKAAKADPAKPPAWVGKAEGAPRPPPVEAGEIHSLSQKGRGRRPG